MRFPTVAICTLTALLAGGLAAQASDSISSGDATQKPVRSEASVEIPNVSSTKGIEATTELNNSQLNTIQPTTINSTPEFSFEHSASAPKTKTAVQGQKEAVAKLPEAEALKSDNSLAKVSTPSVSQPEFSESPNQKPSLVAQREQGAVQTKAEALRSDDSSVQSSTTNTNQLVAEAAKPTSGKTCVAMANADTTLLAQGEARRCPRPQAIPQVSIPKPVEDYAASPALSIYIPVGYGADNNTVFMSGNYQASVRNDPGSVGTGGIGIGLGDAAKSVGAELSYTFETTDDPFGQGGFNAKLHRRLGQDLAGAIGWNGFLNIGRNDFEQSKYGVITKVFRTQDSLSKPFSRVAVTAGVGDGQFRSNGAVKAGDNNVNVFGNVAVRVARPVSFIAEWTGTDLGLGLSIAPFKNIPFVITPAVRDIVGAGDQARFVLGAGTAFRF